MNGHELSHPHVSDAVYRRRVRWGLSVFVALALFVVWREHGAHLLGVLPWLVLLACAAAHQLVHRHRAASRGGSAGRAAKPRPAQHQPEYGGGC